MWIDGGCSAKSCGWIQTAVDAALDADEKLELLRYEWDDLCYSDSATASRVQAVMVTDDTLAVDLEDGRTIAVPIGWYPRLPMAHQRSVCASS